MGEALRAANEGYAGVTAWIVFIAAIVTAFLTALYMTACRASRRSGASTEGTAILTRARARWSRRCGSSPLRLVTVGFLGFPVIGPFQDWITVPGHEHHGFSTLYNIILPVGVGRASPWLRSGIGMAALLHEASWRSTSCQESVRVGLSLRRRTSTTSTTSTWAAIVQAHPVPAGEGRLLDQSDTSSTAS